MGNLLYLIAVILVVLWAVGFFGFGAGELIHFLLFFAIIAIVLRLVQDKKVF